MRQNFARKKVQQRFRFLMEIGNSSNVRRLKGASSLGLVVHQRRIPFPGPSKVDLCRRQIPGIAVTIAFCAFDFSASLLQLAWTFIKTASAKIHRLLWTVVTYNDFIQR